MNSDRYGESDSQQGEVRLPSLLALRFFETAARFENFTRAAEALHLTHGAVSRAVRAIEDELGVALFERRSRRVFLTDAGRRLARAVHDGMALMHQATRELRASARTEQRCVLSCEPTLLMRWLIPRWPDFQARHPEIDIPLVAGGGPFAFGNGIDLAIRRDDFTWPETWHAVPLFGEKIGPVCRPDKAHTWFISKRGQATLRRDVPRLQTRTRPSAWRAWATAAGQSLPDAPEQTFEHFYFSLQAAVAGLGVAIGPWHLVRDDIDTGVLVAPMGFVDDGSRYCLLSPSPLATTGPQQKLLRWLQTQS